MFGWYVMLPAEPVNDVNTNVWLDECERKIFNPKKIGKLFIFRMLIKLCKIFDVIALSGVILLPHVDSVLSLLVGECDVRLLVSVSE